MRVEHRLAHLLRPRQIDFAAQANQECTSLSMPLMRTSSKCDTAVACSNACAHLRPSCCARCNASSCERTSDDCPRCAARTRRLPLAPSRSRCHVPSPCRSTRCRDRLRDIRRAVSGRMRRDRRTAHHRSARSSARRAVRLTRRPMPPPPDRAIRMPDDVRTRLVDGEHQLDRAAPARRRADRASVRSAARMPRRNSARAWHVACVRAALAHCARAVLSIEQQRRVVDQLQMLQIAEQRAQARVGRGAVA